MVSRASEHFDPRRTAKHSHHTRFHSSLMWILYNLWHFATDFLQVYLLSTLSAPYRRKRKLREGENQRRSAEENKKAPTEKRKMLLEAPPGFEPGSRGFAVRCLTTWLWRHISLAGDIPARLFWSGQRGSNSLPPPWQGGALPDELCPHQ